VRDVLDTGVIIRHRCICAFSRADCRFWFSPSFVTVPTLRVVEFACALRNYLAQSYVCHYVSLYTPLSIALVIVLVCE
jgi:hypothetical protein